jgi:hypothetical protein
MVRVARLDHPGAVFRIGVATRRVFDVVLVVGLTAARVQF